MLAFARRGIIQFVSVDIGKLLTDVIELLEHSLNKNILIKKELGSDQLMTTGDSPQLQNVFLNLAFNSQDAMGNGGKLIFKTEKTVPDDEFCKENNIEPGNYIKICISDTGSGIEKENMEHIFEPFFTTKELGMGMGLSAVYGIVKNHKGAIKVNSKIGEGAEFCVLLPLTEPEIKTEKRSLKYNQKSLSGMHIFVVDDEKFICNMLNHILSKAGYKVTVLTDSGEAVREYKKIHKEVDLVVIDMVMPGLNGKDLFLNMKKINPDVNAILSSGYSMEDEYKQIQDMGIKGILHKPFKKNELLDKIAEILISVS
jgi:CheY-like chemotaxis protein